MKSYALTPGRFYLVACECAATYRRASQTMRFIWNEPVGPAQLHAAWPEVRRRLFHDETPTETRIRRSPSNADISDVDRAIDWASLLELNHRRIYLGRLQRVKWSIIRRKEGLTRQGAHKRLVACFHQIAFAESAQLTNGRIFDNSFATLGNLPSNSVAGVRDA